MAKSSTATQRVRPEVVAVECGLTELQIKFAEYYVFLTGFNGPKAVELAGYSCGKNTSDEDKRWNYGRIARENLSHPGVLKYIEALRFNMEAELVVDKIWVLKKLKSLAETGSENTQIKATELLGKSMAMFTDIQQISSEDDPGTIAREAFSKRILESREESKARREEKIIEFPETTCGESK